MTNLLKDNKEVMKYWDFDKNDNNILEKVEISSSKKVWWICKNSHSYRQMISSKVRGVECPICSNRIVLSGFNDMATANPKLLKEWDYEKNTLNPNEVTSGSVKKAWWICEKNHSYEMRIDHRNNGHGCPYCSGRRPINGENDLLTINPELCKEWNYEKNKISPCEISPYSNQKVWWICEKGHEWQAIVNNRAKGNGCPQCSYEFHTSFAEKVVYYYVKKYFSNALENYKPTFLRNKEFDIFIPDKNIGIEYDGQNWHKDINRDLKKDKLCKENNITLIRIREKNCPILNSSSISIILNDTTPEELENKIKYDLLEKNLNIINSDVDINRDTSYINEMVNYTEKSNSLESNYPELCKEWNYEKNKPLIPSQIQCRSSKKVWWICEKGHEWQSIPSNRINGNGCPYCSGRYAIKGKNDLLTMNPEIASEWNYEKNKSKPEDFSPHSAEKVYWKCNKGHEWQAKISNRVLGNNCPYCSGRYAIKGETDLLTLNPRLCEEWNYGKNEISPEEVTPSSEKKVWWKCNKGHEWQASICNRNKGRGCPYCAGKRLIKNVNDLATIYPELAKEWNYEKNKPLTPQDIMSRVSKKVWWLCSKCNHEWISAVNNRVAGNGCPKCHYSPMKKIKR